MYVVMLSVWVASSWSSLFVLVGPKGHVLWEMVGHSAILHGKRPRASSNF